MALQAEALGCTATHISAIETGRSSATTEYCEKFSNWLGLNDQQKKDLMRRLPRQGEVVAFPLKSGHSGSLRLFRKVSKMTPTQIRTLGAGQRRGVPDD
jgi:hypothetical protein